MGGVKRIWYLSPMRAAKVQASLRIRAVSPEPPLLAHTSRESKGTFRQKARSLAPLNGWACAVTICHDGMLEDTNSLDAVHIFMFILSLLLSRNSRKFQFYLLLTNKVFLWLTLPTSDHGVAGSNPAVGEILPEPKRCFIAQSLSCLPFCLEMTEILLKGT